MSIQCKAHFEGMIWDLPSLLLCFTLFCVILHYVFTQPDDTHQSKVKISFVFCQIYIAGLFPHKDILDYNWEFLTKMMFIRSVLFALISALFASNLSNIH